MAAPAASALLIDDAIRKPLAALARSQKAPHRLVVRARIVLAAADGVPNALIARMLSVSEDTVRTWRGRFTDGGIAGLADRRRPGRPPRYGPEVHLRIVATVTGERPEADSVWTHRLIADHLADVGISASQIGRILADLDLKPHRVRGWLTRPDDAGFFSKATAVCDLYLHKPAGSIVVCVDEKTAIGARSRKHPGRRAAPGRVARREFEYIRHGTVSVIAALDVHSGQVITEAISHNNSATFISFLTMLDEQPRSGADHPPRPGQRLLAHLEGHQEMAGCPSAFPDLLHPETRVLARPGRTFFLDPDPQAPTTRRVHLPPGPRGQDRKLHCRLQPHSQALPLDLRRPAPQGHLTPEGLTRRCTSVVRLKFET